MALKNSKEDLDLLKKDLLAQGLLPSEINSENYFELIRVLAARKRDERVELIDPLDAVKANQVKGG